MSKSEEQTSEDTVSNDNTIQVFVRVRPPDKDEASQNSILQVDPNGSTLVVESKPTPRTFSFDHVADIDATQEDIFNHHQKMIDHCMAGNNGTIFAYGSGKTYTMLGRNEEADNLYHEHRGVIPRSFEYLYSLINREQELHGDSKQFLCKCSFLEIYNEKIFDLMEPTADPLPLKESDGKGVYVAGLAEKVVADASEAYGALNSGMLNRRESSRSQAIFTLRIELKEKKGSVEHIRTSQLNFVDLAGSGKQKDANTTGQRFKEACSINTSLLYLGNVIQCLVTVSSTGKKRYIPYRNSKLTFLLRDSLGGNAKTTLIACIHPGLKCLGQTFYHLEFAKRIQMIKNKLKKNLPDLQESSNKKEMLLTSELDSFKMKSEELERLLKTNTTVNRIEKEQINERHLQTVKQKDINDLLQKEEDMQLELSRLQLLMKEQEIEIGHQQHQNAELSQSLEDFRSTYSVAQQQIAGLKKEKEKLEELLGTRHGMGMSGLQSPLGESMSVVVEKRLSELQEEYDKMKTTWVDPDLHQKLKKELESISQANQTIEAKYIESTKKVLALEDEILKHTNTNKMLESSSAQLCTTLHNLDEMTDNNNLLQSKMETLTEKQGSLEKTVLELQLLKKDNETKIQSVEKELSQCRTELVLTRREVETQQEANETRRQTIAQLDSEKLEQSRAHQRLSVELSSWKSKAESTIQQVSELKKELAASEDRLKNETEDLQRLEVKLSNTEVNMKNLSEKLSALETELVGDKEDVKRERGEWEEMERQLSYLRDQNDTLSAELSSQQQQLAAVEEEKRVLEAERSEMRASHTTSLEDLRVQSEKDLKFINIEKMELERQLQSSQKCYYKQECRLTIELLDTEHEPSEDPVEVERWSEYVEKYVNNEDSVTEELKDMLARKPVFLQRNVRQWRQRNKNQKTAEDDVPPSEPPEAKEETTSDKENDNANSNINSDENKTEETNKADEEKDADKEVKVEEKDDQDNSQDSVIPKPPEDIDIIDNTECKFNVNSFKLVYVVNSESYLYKRMALKRAREDISMLVSTHSSDSGRNSSRASSRGLTHDDSDDLGIASSVTSSIAQGKLDFNLKAFSLHDPGLTHDDSDDLGIESSVTSSIAQGKLDFNLKAFSLHEPGITSTPNKPSVDKFIKRYMSHIMRNRIFAYAKSKAQICFAVTAKLLRAFVFYLLEPSI